MRLVGRRHDLIYWDADTRSVEDFMGNNGRAFPRSVNKDERWLCQVAQNFLEFHFPDTTFFLQEKPQRDTTRQSEVFVVLSAVVKKFKYKTEESIAKAEQLREKKRKEFRKRQVRQQKTMARRGRGKGGADAKPGQRVFRDRRVHHAAAADALGGRAGHLVQLVRWEQGLVVPRGNPHGVADGARLLAPELRLATRSAGAGAQKLLQRLWQRAGGDGRPQGMVARDHAEVARLVRWGVADTGVAIAAAAQAEGLDFVAVAEERFDLVVSDAHLQQPAIARVVELLGSPSFRAEARRLPGYDPLHAGHVESVGAA